MRWLQEVFTPNIARGKDTGAKGWWRRGPSQLGTLGKVQEMKLTPPNPSPWSQSEDAAHPGYATRPLSEGERLQR